MKLYYSPVSPYSRKALCAFYEKGVQFDREVIDLFDPEAKATYLEIHPYGKVPLLELDDGYKIPESSIIVEWLDTHHDSGLQLIPSDKDLARRVRFHDRMGDLYLIQPAGEIFFQYFSPADKRDKNLIEKANQTINTTLKLADTHLEHDYIMSNEFSYADLAMAAGLSLVNAIGINLNDYRKIKSYYERCMARDSWKKIQEESAPIEAKLAEMLQN